MWTDEWIDRHDEEANTFCNFIVSGPKNTVNRRTHTHTTVVMMLLSIKYLLHHT